MDRTVFITGASSDIGLAVVRQLLREGCSVIAHYHRSSEALKQLQSSYGDRVALYQADFTDSKAIEKLQNEAPSWVDGVNVLVNLSALKESVVYDAIDASALIRHFTANVVPAVLLTQWLGEKMAERGWGRIVNISSVGVKFGGGADTFCYSLTKHANEFMPAIHKKWAARNVLVNAVRVGVTKTKYFDEMDESVRNAREALIPMKRMALPEEIAEFICWLVSEKNTFTTGQVMSVSGGE